MPNANDFLVIDPKDNVAVALRDLHAGETLKVNDTDIVLLDDVRIKNKFALYDIGQNEAVIKYGSPIGHAVRPVKRGGLVHTEQVATNLKGLTEYHYEPCLDFVEKKAARSSFMGYVRDNGEVGIRNEIWIINTVGCVNKVSENLARSATEKYGDKVDGVYSFAHHYGCAQLGDDLARSQNILKGLVNNPNAAGVLVLGLGCEKNNVDAFKEVLDDYNPDRLRFMITQNVEDEIEEGLKLIGELVEYAQRFRRSSVPLSKLRVGLKCGASDGFSGITANPLLGRFSDQLVSSGGTVVLSEISEMFGAETILMNRCRNRATFDKMTSMINENKEHFLSHGIAIYENPSYGNLRSGISTCEEKSLGCIHKGGSSPVTDVLKYSEPVKTPGLNILASPSDDIIVITALAASGVQMVLFTTGNGNPLGTVVPTVKVSSNTPVYERKKGWIDFNAGSLLEGKDRDEIDSEFFNLVIDIASGEKKARNEITGNKDIDIFKNGVTL